MTARFSNKCSKTSLFATKTRGHRPRLQLRKYRLIWNSSRSGRLSLESQSESELRLTRETAAAAEILRFEERRADALITAGIVEVRVVGQVVDLGGEIK